MATANFATRFEPAINPTQIVPGGAERFALQQTPKDDAIPSQEDARESFEGLLRGWVGGSIRFVCGGRKWPEQRPAAGELDAGHGAVPPFSVGVGKGRAFFRR